jgi:hypothetical protein
MPRRKTTPPKPSPLLDSEDDSIVLPPELLGGVEIPAGAAVDAGPDLDRLLDDQRRILAELVNRSQESLPLYEPLEIQEAFHKAKTQIRLLRGSNRGGKTLPAAVEVARALTGQDPHGKYPLYDGRAYAVGRDGEHCGEVMFRKLFRTRAFFVIRDKETGLWRTWRPWEAGDLIRQRETRPAPPLISKRFYNAKKIAWEDKKQGIPKHVQFHNGWELNFYSSKGDPPQGSDLDLVWLDEEIIDPRWVPEMLARLLDRNGKFIWSFTPQAGTTQALDLHERGESEVEDGVPDEERSVKEFIVLLDDNKYMAEKAKRDFKRNITDEQEAAVRIGGDYAILGNVVYPEFGKQHIVDHVCLNAQGQPLLDPPLHWTRYIFVDPGRQRCAVLFGAIPPPSEDPHAYVYDELYIKDCDAGKFGRAVADKLKDKQLQAMFIDRQEGRKREAGSGRSIEAQYSLALKKAGVKCMATGHDFQAAPSDLKGGIESVYGWLNTNQSGIIRLKVLRPRCKYLIWEMGRYCRKKDPRGMPTDEVVKRNDHLCDGLRYFAAVDPPYVKPKRRRLTLSWVHKYLADKRARRKKKGRKNINLGPGE